MANVGESDQAGSGPSSETAGGTCAECGAGHPLGARFCAGCGNPVALDAEWPVRRPPASAQAPADELIEALRHATLGEYDVYGLLGRGGMASVYLALDLALNRKVAVKVISTSMMTTEDSATRFLREAQTAAALNHPNIIPIYSVRRTADLLYFVMRYVEGSPLDAVIRESRTLSVRMTRAILSQVASALQFAHRKGVVHRDIKPANIMIDEDGNAIVTDYGIAKVEAGKNLTMTGAVMGTPYYMSPEQISGHQITGAADQYSLGVMAYEMLIGRTPFAGDSVMTLLKAHLWDPPQPIREIRTELTPHLADTVMRMLAKAPADRWPDLSEFVRALDAKNLPEDDDLRSQIIDLAKTGIANRLRISVPLSPVPPARPARSAPAGSNSTSGVTLHDVELAAASGGDVASAGQSHETVDPLTAARREVERLEAEHREAQRLDAARREAKRLDAEREATERAEAARQEAARQEAARQEAAREEAAREEAAREEAARDEAARDEAARLEAARQEAERKAAERLEAERADATRQDAERLEAARREAEQAEAKHHEAERQEAARKEVARLEVERAESARNEAEHREAVRREAEESEKGRKREAQPAAVAAAVAIATPVLATAPAAGTRPRAHRAAKPSGIRAEPQLSSGRRSLLAVGLAAGVIASVAVAAWIWRASASTQTTAPPPAPAVDSTPSLAPLPPRADRVRGGFKFLTSTNGVELYSNVLAPSRGQLARLSLRVLNTADKAMMVGVKPYVECNTTVTPRTFSTYARVPAHTLQQAEQSGFAWSLCPAGMRVSAFRIDASAKSP